MKRASGWILAIGRRVRTCGMVFLCLAAMLAVPVRIGADWQPGDGHKMHFPQLPDEEGWDVNATAPMVLADDWRCSQTGPVTDVHFWGSWRDMDGDGVGDEGTIQYFVVSIHEDIPAGVGGVPYSRPGATLREWQLSAQAVPIDPPTFEAWYDPATGSVVPNDHDAYFQYNIKNLNAIVPDPFVQVEGTIYWLNISAVLADLPGTREWGWKSSRDHFNDDAVWATWGSLNWTDMYEPPRYNEFNAAIDPLGGFVGSGTNYYGQGWYFYPGSEWWNIWFYDNPFTTQNVKAANVAAQVRPADPLQPAFLTFAVNWSTPEWSLEGNPPGQPRQPPLPGVDEARYIGRQILWQGVVPAAGLDLSEFWQNPYNPEWVSIDVMGTNFAISNGTIYHECVRTSLDLAFVITGREPPEACCLLVAVDPVCQDLPPTQCQAMAGVPQGPGTACSSQTEACCMPDDSCKMIDPLCCDDIGGTPMGPQSACAGSGACCSDTDGTGTHETCAIADKLCCVAGGGNFIGVGEVCWGTGACCLDITNGNVLYETCEGMDAQCCGASGGVFQGLATSCTAFEACCFPDGKCVDLDPLCCRANGGEPQGPGTNCATTTCVSVPTEACCLWDGTCVDLPRDRCCDIGGTPQGEGTDCTTADCPPPTPIDVGMNIDVHQDNPVVPPPNDFHIEGMIESSEVPVLVEHIDGSFPNFSYSIVEDPPGNGLWYKFTADWWGREYPFCEILHLGLKFQVVCHNVMIDLVGWWTRDGVRVGGPVTVAQAGPQPGFWPVLGFDVEDNIRANPHAQPPDPRGQHIRIQSGNGDGLPEPGEFHVEVVGMGLVALTEPFPLSELRVGGAQEQLPWVEVLHNPGGPPLSLSDPIVIVPDSFFDVFFEIPQPDQPTTATQVVVQPGGYLLARQLVRFTGNGGVVAAQQPGEELRWFWEMHGAHSLPQPEACCMPDGSCQYLLPSDCVCNNGTPQGPGTVCSMILAPCCLPDGSCRMVDPLCCDDLGGTPSPTGATACLGDQNGNGADDACEVAKEACCLATRTCVEVPYNKCLTLGGDPQGPGTICDMRYCAALKWVQPPTYGSVITPKPPCFWGWNEVSDYFAGPIAADDWACDTDRPITDIHWWGSYLNWTTQQPPPAGMGPVGFHIGIWTDVPAEVDRPFSHPGRMVWQWVVQRDVLNERWVGCDEYPGQPSDSCFRYDFTIPQAEWFYQAPSADPTIYWISISAVYLGPQGPNPWGWKTREHFFNDDAVRILAPTAPPLGAQFGDGVPIESPDGDSWDMAFVLTTVSPGASKWDQWPNPDLPGLHAHSGITLADNWECQGGKVTDFHWWGNYELDADDNEIRGSGIDCINISIHADRPDVPWCVPQDPELWGVCALFSGLNEHDTGMVNSEGSKIYEYDFYFEPGFPQEIGQIYWLNLEAFAFNVGLPALWRWQESARTATPRLCPAAERTPSQAWHTVPPWPDDPPRYSEMAFRVTSTPYPPHPDPAGVSKNRYLSLVVTPTVPGPGPLTALRVGLADLQHPLPANYAVSPPMNYTPFDVTMNGTCVGGTHNGHHCDGDADCRLCVGGLQDRRPCQSNADCAGPPAGACPAVGGTCSNMTACSAVGEGNSCGRWVGKPALYLESQDDPTRGSFKGARLQCTPYYDDWGAEGVVHVTGAEIVPSSDYAVVSYAASCAGNEDTCAAVSAPTRIRTARSGDVAPAYNPPSTTSQPDALDVAAIVNKFKSLPGSPAKVAAQLQPNLPDLNGDINALDIASCVDAFKGFAYAYSGPCVCPSTVPCNATACANASACIGLYGAAATCLKSCTSGPRAGMLCTNNAHCGECAAGIYAGYPCDADIDCPGSACNVGTCGTGFCRDRCGRCTPP